MRGHPQFRIRRQKDTDSTNTTIDDLKLAGEDREVKVHTMQLHGYKTKNTSWLKA